MSSSGSGTATDGDCYDSACTCTAPEAASSRTLHAARLVAEASQVVKRVAEIEAKKQFEYVRRSGVEKLRDEMEECMLKLALSSKTKSQLEGGQEVVASRKLAKEIGSMAWLVKDIANCKRLEKARSADLSWKGFDIEKIQKQHEIMSKAADGIDADIKEFQERIGRL